MTSHHTQKLLIWESPGHLIEYSSPLVLIQVDQCDVIPWRSFMLMCPYRWVKDHRAIDHVIELAPDPFCVEHSQVGLEGEKILVGQEVVVHDEHEGNTQIC